MTCNESPIYSWIAGTCQSNGTCVCASGFVLNSSGLCALASRDAGPDVTPDAKGVCTPGLAPSCNDDPISAAVMGVCQPNGTCVCNNGYEKNPNTGKCTRPASPACTGTYDACGCGCCTGGSTATVCYYPSAGESITAIQAADQAAAASPSCASAGCSMKRHYLCCAESASEPAGSAQYKATYTVGGIDRIGLTRTGNDGTCAFVNFLNPGSNAGWRPYQLNLPTNWGFDESSASSSCGSAITAQIMGAQGTVTFTPNGSSCAINAHMTVFFYDTKSATISSTRLDADNVPISGGGPSGYCK
jgi:hypothetical protein